MAVIQIDKRLQKKETKDMAVIYVDRLQVTNRGTKTWQLYRQTKDMAVIQIDKRHGSHKVDKRLQRRKQKTWQ